jgi:hypothetical protein
MSFFRFQVIETLQRAIVHTCFLPHINVPTSKADPIVKFVPFLFMNVNSHTFQSLLNIPSQTEVFIEVL